MKQDVPHMAGTCAPNLRCTLATLIIAVLATTQAAAGDKSADDSLRHQEWAHIATQSGRTLRAFVVFPQTSRPLHAVIIVHEDRGLTSWERSMADDLAAAGHVAIAPDLLSEMGPNKGSTDAFDSPAATREAIYRLTTDQLASDLDAVVDYASNLAAVDKKVAVAGFGWGGDQAFAYAAHNPDIAAVMVFYGTAPGDEFIKQIRRPVYGFYGENDVRTSGDVPKLKQRMKELSKDYQAVTYAGAGHGFMRAGEAQDAKPADRKAREAAWARLVLLLSKI